MEFTDLLHNEIHIYAPDSYKLYEDTAPVLRPDMT